MNVEGLLQLLCEPVSLTAMAKLTKTFIEPILRKYSALTSIPQASKATFSNEVELITQAMFHCLSNSVGWKLLCNEDFKNLLELFGKRHFSIFSLDLKNHYTSILEEIGDGIETGKELAIEEAAKKRKELMKKVVAKKAAPVAKRGGKAVVNNSNDDDDDDAGDCIVCLDAKIRRIFYPCGHRGVCWKPECYKEFDAARRMNSCHYCRQKIVTTKPILLYEEKLKQRREEAAAKAAAQNRRKPVRRQRQ